MRSIIEKYSTGLVQTAHNGSKLVPLKPIGRRPNRESLDIIDHGDPDADKMPGLTPFKPMPSLRA